MTSRVPESRAPMKPAAISIPPTIAEAVVNFFTSSLFIIFAIRPSPLARLSVSLLKVSFLDLAAS